MSVTARESRSASDGVGIKLRPGRSAPGPFDAAPQPSKEDGVEALTMRKLATALDANPMSLYHHVPNKDAVLRGVAARVGSQCREGQREDIP
ncbi:TetR/AcrR family transcriptional regulator [Streptomyces sp. NPDC058228]|uniref:TetR/AcrR family transcriptional regulator n=1 Tax=Streptomyces sp. NPDC058228 TaxID=3346390 RepID=UPI0036E2AFC4